ncbi:MAG: hypothetical protein FJ035_05065 [Chloroflexi bacterium]|nr:hypothetical protein [Chloroflexota bacterium]
MQTMSTPGSVVKRALRAARGEEALYEEVEADAGANMQAAIVVLAGAVASGIGFLLQSGDAGGLIVGIVSGLLGWLGYAYACFLIGTRVFHLPQTKSTFSEVTRVLGFASAPRVLLVLGGTPVLGIAIAAVVGVWGIVLTVIALRAALDFTLPRAIGTAIAAVIVLAVIQGIASETMALL